eukprot:11211276-Lingulodinium_polyedra.AAC.1
MEGVKPRFDKVERVVQEQRVRFEKMQQVVDAMVCDSVSVVGSALRSSVGAVSSGSGSVAPLARKADFS